MNEELASFATGYNYQKLAAKDSVTYNLAAGTHNRTITHNLNRICSVRVWYDPGTGRRFPAFNQPWQITENSTVGVRSYLTLNTLEVRIFNSGSTKDITIYYRIYYDT